MLTRVLLDKKYFLPKIPLLFNGFLIQFRRVQFSIKVYLAMTIDRVQVQTIAHCSVDLKSNYFSHGQ